jgi:hypothetical protein
MLLTGFDAKKVNREKEITSDHAPAFGLGTSKKASIS